MITREQFVSQKLGNRRTGRHQARQTKDTVSLSSPGGSPSPRLRQLVPTHEDVMEMLAHNHYDVCVRRDYFR